MSAADDYPAVAILADAARSMNQRPETVRMFEEITDLRAELSALKARRCDGCAHTAPKWRYYPNDGLRCARLHADVPVDFSCAAWTEKP